MTPKEAIKNLKKLKSFHNGSYGTAIDHAIKALEQQPKTQDCEHCIHTYGTLGCCDMVNNEWIYDCEFGKEQYKKEHESQPCEDCISREDVIKIFGEVHPLDYNKQSYIANIQKLPSATPKTRWIPVSERLPKKYETVLLTSIWHEVEKAMYIGDGLFDIIINNLQKEDVIAWMPLPQPYAESEDKE